MRHWSTCSLPVVGGTGLEPRLDPSCVSSLSRWAKLSIPESPVFAVDSGLHNRSSNAGSLLGLELRVYMGKDRF